MKERVVRSRRIYRGRAVGFSADIVALPGGKTAVREYLNHPGAVAVLAFASASKILLVHQYRYPVRSATWEIPAGKMGPSETPRVCLERELEEETGFKPGRVRRLLSYWPTPAFSDEVIHIYAAWELRKGVFKPDEDELITPRAVPFKTALRWARTGKIRDSKTVIALLYAATEESARRMR